MVNTHKPFDVVIFGATGYTGQLVIEYFLTHPETSSSSTDGNLKWAIAGRNATKIQQVKQTLTTRLHGQVNSDAIDQVPVIVADGNDRAAMESLVHATRVVLSVAGPYALHSALLVELCAQNGVHYCDLTGEMTWAQQNVTNFEKTAQKSGAKVVHCCGFEAVPSDIMAFLLADFAIKQCHTKISKLNFFWTDTLGSASGGTCASLLNMLDTATTQQLKEMQNPFFFTSPAYQAQKQALVQANTSSAVALPFDDQLQCRSAVFIGAMINQHVVLRSNYLLNDYYGSNFAYIERMGLGSLWNYAMAVIMGVVGALAMFSWTRPLLWKISPQSGEGPSEEMLHKGYFKAKAFAYGEDGTLVAKGESSCVGDPGYLVTSKMISEVAICLAKNEHDGALSTGGFLTPASACGHSLATRLMEKKIVDFQISRA